MKLGGPFKYVESHLTQSGVHRQRSQGFTLIELMAVVLVIALLFAITLGAARFVSEKAKRARAQGEIAALEAAIEGFKADNGYYPTSSVYRLSYQVYLVKINSGLLYKQLSMGGNKYIRLKTDQLAFDSLSGMTNIIDPWGSPIAYYCYLTNVSSAVSISSNWFGSFGNATFDNWVVIGGQQNAASFDLFSYGPDKMTYIPNAPSPWGSVSSANDDIWSGR